MKKRFAIIISTAVVCAVALATFYNRPAEGVGGEDASLNPSARITWELLRLRDPNTGKIPPNVRAQELAFAAGLSVQNDAHGAKSPSVLGTDWAFRGPWNVGGRTRALALDVNNENTILAGGVSSGMWRSTDGGVTWARTTGSDQLQSVSCVAQDKRQGKTNIWYYGTGEIWGNSADLNGDGLFKSTDSGKTWTPIASTVMGTPNTWDNKFEYVWRIATDPSNTEQDEVYAVPALGGVFRSMDGGTTWNAVLGTFGNSSSLFTDIAVTSTGVVYAALSEFTVGTNSAAVRGIYRSTDGENWVNITPAGWAEKYKRIVIGIAPSDENQVYFLAETPDVGFKGEFVLTTETRTEWHSLWKYTYISGDGTGGGATWEDRSKNLPALGGRTGDFVSQGSYDLVIAVKPNDPNAVFIGGTNIYRSTDGFTSTTATAWIGGYAPSTATQKFPAYENHHSDQHAFAFLPSSPQVLLSGNDGGIQRTENNLAANVQWTPLNNGYITSQFYTVAVDKSNDNSTMIMGGLQDNGTWFTMSANHKVHWKKPWGADGAYCAIAKDRSSYYASAQLGKIYRFLIDENGDTLRSTRVDPKGATGYLFINPFTLDPHNTDRMYMAGGSVLWRNNDLTAIPMGQTEDPVEVNWDSLSATRVADTISAVSVSTIPANRVYYGTIRGDVFRMDNAHTGNPTPTKVTGNTFPKNAYVNCIAIDPRNADRAVVVFTNYNVQSLFYTEDGGANWTPIGGNLEQSSSGAGTGPSCRWAAIVPVQDNTVILVGTSIGLFSTSYLDGTWTVWQHEGAGSIGNAIVNMIDARTSDGLTAIATHGAGMYSGLVTTTASVVPERPVLTAPTDGSKSIGETALLEWETVASAAYYVVEVSTSPTFTTLHLQQGGLAVTELNVAGLEPGLVRYYWRVRAVNSGGTSEYSPVWSFITIIAAPELVAPSSGETDVSRVPTLTWDAVNGAVSYYVQIATNITFGSIVEEQSGLTSLSFTTSELEANRRYYWRVRAVDASGKEGPFSVRRSFTTGTSTDVREENNKAGIVLLPNHPNPVATQTTMRFTLPRQLHVALVVYNELGKKVLTVVNSELHAGDHALPLDVSTLANGRYFYTLTAGGVTQTKEMVVRK